MYRWSCPAALNDAHSSLPLTIFQDCRMLSCGKLYCWVHLCNAFGVASDYQLPIIFNKDVPFWEHWKQQWRVLSSRQLTCWRDMNNTERLSFSYLIHTFFILRFLTWSHPFGFNLSNHFAFHKKILIDIISEKVYAVEMSTIRLNTVNSKLVVEEIEAELFC